MKLKLTSFFLLIFSVLVFAQNKKIQFTHQLKYALKFDNTQNPMMKQQNLDFTVFKSQNNEYLITTNIKTTPYSFFHDALGTTIVNIGLNNQLVTGYLPSFQYFRMEDENGFEQKFASVKLNTTETVLGIPCQNYLLKPVFVSGDENVKNSNNLKVCVNESHFINNFPVLTGVYNSVEHDKVQFNLSGLILKIGSEKKYDKEALELKSINSTNDYVMFDHKTSLEEQKKFRDSMSAEYKKMAKLWDSDSAIAVVDSAAAIVDSASAIVDSASAAVIAAAESGYFIDKYKSEYKKERTELQNLAIDNLPTQKLKEGLPSHCFRYRNELPDFKNKELKTRLSNYIGQICDMYLTQSYEDTVDEKGTIDEIRREVWKMLMIRDKLDKADKKKLDKFLEDLD